MNNVACLNFYCWSCLLCGVFMLMCVIIKCEYCMLVVLLKEIFVMCVIVKWEYCILVVQLNW